MKTSSAKPSVGCNRAGFTFVDADGRLVQLYWEDLQSAGEALYCFDGVSWKRVRNVSAFMRRVESDASLRFAVAPVDADESVLRERSVKFPAGLLLGDGAARVARARELLALPRAMVEGSMLWDSLSDSERSAISALRYSHGQDATDTEILAALHAGLQSGSSPREVFESEVRALFAGVHDAPMPRDLFGYANAPGVSDAIASGRIDASDFVALFSACSARSFGMAGSGNGFTAVAAGDILSLLAEFADAPDPVVAALSSAYAIPVGPRQRMLLAFDVLSNGLTAPEEAFTVAGRLLERGVTSGPGVDLAALSLLRSGSSEGLDEVLDAFAADPVAAVRRFGSPDVVLRQKLPELPALQRAAMLELVGLSASALPTSDDLAVLDRFDPELFLRVSALLDGAEGSQYEGGVDFAVRVIAVFGDRAPEWLLKNASSPGLDRARLLERLPDAATASSRVRQLAEVLDTPAPTDEQRADAEAAASAIVGIVDALRRRERGEFLSSLASSLEGDGVVARNALRQISDGEELLGFVLDADTLLARAAAGEIDDQSQRALVSIASLLGSDRQAAASATRKFLAAGGDPSLLLRFAAEDLRGQSAGLLGPATLDALEGFRAVSDRDDLLLSLLPTSAAANKRSKSLDDSPAAQEFLLTYANLLKAGDFSGAAEHARRAFSDPVLAAVLFPPAKQAGQRLDALKPLLESEDERAARMVGLRKDHEAWTRYSEAILSGDQEALVAVGAELFPERDPGRISVHDALYWLPANPQASVAPDGSSFGEWLLDADRGSSALRTETGRRSLGLAAASWASNGSRSAVVKDLSDAVLAAGFGGYRDDLSLFFVSNKISKKSAQASLDALRASKDTPTLLPLGEVFEDASTGIRGYFLPRTDPRGMQAGVFTDCCQHPDSAGATCAFAGQTHPSSGFFVVEDSSGQILAQSWVWAADGTGESSPGVIFDNVEARLSGADASRVAAVRQVYDAAADMLATRFDRVMIGAGNDVPMTDLPLVESSENLLAASIGYSGYLGDSSRQRLYRAGVLSGPRFLGAEGGFRVVEGSSEVFVSADGSVRLDGPDARNLAERALAGSTRRAYHVVDTSGTPTGETFEVGTVSPHALSLDLEAAPPSYDNFSSEVLTLTGELTGLPEEGCAAWLRATGGDPRLAAKTFGAGLTLEEYTQVAHAVGRVGRVPTFPAVVDEQSMTADERSKLREGFLRLWSQEPNVAERLFSSPTMVTAVSDLLSAGGTVSSTRDRVVLENLVAAAPLLPGRSRQERTELLVSSVGAQVAAEKAGFASSVRGLGLTRAVEEAKSLGLTSGDIEALLRLAPEFGSREGVALLDRSSREKFASLGWEEQSEVRSVIDYTLRDSAYMRPDLDFALELAAEPDRSLRYAAVRNSPSGCDPRTTLRFLQQVPFVADSPIAEIRESFADPAVEKSDVLASVASRYAAAQRYIYDRSDDVKLSVEETVAIISADFAGLVDKCHDLGMEMSYGENIMPYSFPARSIPLLASKSAEELREVASVVSVSRRYGSDLAAAVTSGLTVDHLAAVTPPGTEPRLFDSSKLEQALRAGVTPDEVRSFAKPGVDMDMFEALLGSPRLREAFLAVEDPEVTSRVVVATDGTFDDQVLDLALELATRDADTRRQVLDLFTPPAPVSGDSSLDGSDEYDYFEYDRRPRVNMPQVHVRLAEIAGLTERLGGFRPLVTTRW